jgi:hypothetical protein
MPDSRGSGVRWTLKNQWHNHTGLSAANLLLNNVWVMYRYDVQTNKRPYRGWFRGTLYLLRAVVTGWWGPHDLRACRIRKVPVL